MKTAAEATADAEAKASGALRIPAQSLEDAVLGALVGFLRDEARLIGLMGTVAAEEARRRLRDAAALAGRLAGGASADRMEGVARIVARVTVGVQSIRILVRPASIWSVGEAKPEDPVEAIELPMQLKRCAMAVRLIVRVPGACAVRRVDPKLAALVARAIDCFARLSSGRCDSVQAIARDEQMGSSYVTRVMYLAFLAPDIVQRILRGDHPADLGADRLLRMVPLSVAWEEQRELIGMAN